MDSPTSQGKLVMLSVDVQTAAVDKGPHRVDEVIANIAALMAACRTAGVEVVHVQHDGEVGSDEEPGTYGWKIYEGVAPAPGERVFRKRYNSAFRGTPLEAYLRECGVDTLVVVGIQTEYCVDSTVRVAFENGFSVVMPELTNTTFDNGDVSAEQIYRMYNERIFADRFAAVPSMDEAVRMVSAGGLEA